MVLRVQRQDKPLACLVVSCPAFQCTAPCGVQGASSSLLRESGGPRLSRRRSTVCWHWQGWRTFGAGYVHDALGGRIGYGALDSFALRMTNGDWRDSAGATQTLVLNQEVASAVVVSGWSRADKVRATQGP